MKTIYVFMMLIIALAMGKIIHVCLIHPLVSRVFGIPAGKSPAEASAADIVSGIFLLLSVGLFLLLIRWFVVYFDLSHYLMK